MFCDKLGKVAGDKLVVYDTGEVMNSDCCFKLHRYYMYLKEGESYTVNKEFDMRGIECQVPPGRPLQRKYAYHPRAVILVYVVVLCDNCVHFRSIPAILRPVPRRGCWYLP